MIIPGPVPLLVGITWPAIPNLELHAISVGAKCNVEALRATIGSDGAICEGPELVVTTGTVADADGRAIGVTENTLVFLVEVFENGGIALLGDTCPCKAHFAVN